MTANINIQSTPGLAAPHPPKALTPKSDEKDVKAETEKNVSNVTPYQMLKPTKESEESKDAKETKNSKETKESIQDAVEQLNEYVQSSNRNLRFNVDDESGRTVVQVIDAETDELIRQLPDDEALRIARNIQQSMKEDPENNELLLIKLEA